MPINRQCRQHFIIDFQILTFQSTPIEVPLIYYMPLNPMQKLPSHICMNPNLMEPSSTSPLFYHVENFHPHHLWQGEVPILIPGVLHRRLFVAVRHQDADHHREDMAGRTEATSIHTGRDPCLGHALRGGTEAVQDHTHPDRVHHQDVRVEETALDAME